MNRAGTGTLRIARAAQRLERIGTDLVPQRVGIPAACGPEAPASATAGIDPPVPPSSSPSCAARLALDPRQQTVQKRASLLAHLTTPEHTRDTSSDCPCAQKKSQYNSDLRRRISYPDQIVQLAIIVLKCSHRARQPAPPLVRRHGLCPAGGAETHRLGPHPPCPRYLQLDPSQAPENRRPGPHEYPMHPHRHGLRLTPCRRVCPRPRPIMRLT